ncbi:Eukaryotic translation initiation factor 3 subunit M, partial [Ascosphaera acerosa]
FVARIPLARVHADLAAASAAEALRAKMRLLTLASLAASVPSRSLSYDAIASALRIERAQVEGWVIDAVRAGLVEGKLSQLRGEFLVQRSTYRVFGERQGAEVQGRLMVWRQSLETVLSAIRTEREDHVEMISHMQRGATAVGDGVRAGRSR